MWIQDKKFNLAKMGTTPGKCLGNTRSAFGIPSKYHSAKDAMLAAKKAGHLHPISSAPKNCAVPVFADTSSPYEHVMVDDCGTFYSDGKKLIDPETLTYFGWSESLNGVRVVSWVEDAPTPKPDKPALKTNEQIADEVIAGKWGNGQERKDRLTKAGYDYSAIQAIVNKKCAKKPDASPLRAGDTVRIVRWVDEANRPLRQLGGTYRILQLHGTRAVVTRNGGIFAAMPVGNLVRA